MRVVTPLLFCILVAWVAQSSCAAAQDLRIEHITIVSPERRQPLHNVHVTVLEGHIAAIGTEHSDKASRGEDVTLQTLDGRGLYLIPGLIDSHVHLSTVPGMTAEQERAHPEIAARARDQIPRSYLYFGFTTLIDLASTPDAIAHWKKSRGPMPETYFCGSAPVVDGYPMNWTLPPERYRDWPYMIVQPGDEASTPAGIDPAAHTPEAVVARMKADGAICVKTYFHRYEGQNLRVPRLDTLRALVKAAHAAGILVFMHAISPEGHSLALDAGVDVIAHGLWEWDDDGLRPRQLTPDVEKILDRMIATRTGLQPTMQVAYGFRDLFDSSYLSDPRLELVFPPDLIAWYRTSEGQWFRDSIRSGVLGELATSNDASAQWARAQKIYAPVIRRNGNATWRLFKGNGRLLFGTDTPAVPTYANPPGLNGWLEMHRLVEAGVTPAEIFRAATLTNAEALGLIRELGTVEVGKRANLLLVRADPRQTIQAYADIATVILGGRVLDPGRLKANGPGSGLKP